MVSKPSELIFENRYICQKELKQGAFGIVFQGFDLVDKRSVAIKLEKDKKSHITSSLTNESRILTKLKGLKGVPTLFWSGKKPQSDDRALIMTYLGSDLQTHLTKLRSFSLKTVLMCGVQLVKVLQSVHNKGIVHRDIKPDNILTLFEGDSPLKSQGLMQEKDVNQLYLCDFGISKVFRENNKHIDYKINKPFIGTIRFASEAAHKGFEISRKDDLESLGYVLVFLYKGKLPWQNIDRALGNLRKDRVGSCKTLEKILEFFYDLPEEFLLFFKYVKNLTFKENPNYEYLQDLLQNMAKKRGFNLEDGVWDWRKKGKGVCSYTGNYAENTNKNFAENIENFKENFTKENLKENTKRKMGNTPCVKKKTFSESEENSPVNHKEKAKENEQKPKINIKQNFDYNSDFEGKKEKKDKKEKKIVQNSHFMNKCLLVVEHDNNHLHEGLDSHDKEVYFNSKSLISSYSETYESSVLIKNKDFTTLKYNIDDQEENGKKLNFLLMF